MAETKDMFKNIPEVETNTDELIDELL